MTSGADERKRARAVGKGDAGTRLDKYLATVVPELSRARLKALLEAGRVGAGGETITDPAYRVKQGQSFTIRVPPAGRERPAPEAIPLEVVYEDAHLIVIDKPAGLVVHPAPGNPNRTLVNALIAHCGQSLSGIGGVRRPGIVHRLDKNTSGLLVAAKTDSAHLGLAAQFAAHDFERAYYAVVWGVPLPRRGEIRGAIGRDPRNRKKMALVRRGGKPALTRYRVLESYSDVASLVDCRPATGRTHQIRVHFAHSGHPLIGDRTYGRARGRRLQALPEAALSAITDLGRQALHARLIAFSHPVSQERLRFESALPPDMGRLVGILASL